MDPRDLVELEWLSALLVSDDCGDGCDEDRLLRRGFAVRTASGLVITDRGRERHREPLSIKEQAGL